MFRTPQHVSLCLFGVVIVEIYHHGDIPSLVISTKATLKLSSTRSDSLTCPTFDGIKQKSIFRVQLILPAFSLSTMMLMSLFVVIAVAMVVATEAFAPRSFMQRGHGMQLAMRGESCQNENVVSNVGKALTSFTLAAGLFVSPVFAADVAVKSTTTTEKAAAPAAPKSTYKGYIQPAKETTKVAAAPTPSPKAYVIEKDTALLDQIRAVKKTTLPPSTKSAPTVEVARPAVTAAPSKPSPSPVAATKKAPGAPAARQLPEEVVQISHPTKLTYPTILTHPSDHFISSHLTSPHPPTSIYHTHPLLHVIIL